MKKLIFGLCLVCAVAVIGEEGNPSSMKSALLVSPLVGWVENEETSQGAPGQPSVVSKDDSAEYGLYAMYASPRCIINNTVFFTDVNDSEVSGDIASLGFYGKPESRITWFVGGSYVWHKIENDTVEVEITEPLIKAGPVFRIPSLHLSLNPYVGYAQMEVDTEVNVPPMRMSSTDTSDMMVYGVSAYWRWRMLYANAKYYMEDDLDHDEQNHIARIWASAMFTQSAGILARVEYSERGTSKDTSMLVGPVFVF